MSEILVKLKVDTSNLQQEMKQAEGIIENETEKIEKNLAISPKFEIKNVNELKKALLDIGKASGEVANFENLTVALDGRHPHQADVHLT